LVYSTHSEDANGTVRYKAGRLDLTRAGRNRHFHWTKVYEFAGKV